MEIDMFGIVAIWCLAGIVVGEIKANQFPGPLDTLPAATVWEVNMEPAQWTQTF